jgi:hypothetical protein
MFSLMRGSRSNEGLSDGAASVGGGGGALQALKAASFASRYPEPTDPEYVSLKASTDALADALDAALAQARAVDASWARLAADHAAFAAALHAADRHDDALRDGRAAALGLAKAAAALTSTQGVNPAANGGRRRNAAHAVALDQVRRYVAHLRAIQGRYRDVCKAKAEYEGCAAKVQSLKGRPQTASTAAGLQKYGERHALSDKIYHAMLDRLIERMRLAMERKPQALALIGNAFWLQQSCLHAEMGCVQEPVYDAARATEPLLVSCNLMQGLAAPSSMFAALDTRSAGPTKPLPLTASKSLDANSANSSRRGGGGGGGGTGVAVGSTAMAKSHTSPRPSHGPAL